MTDVAAFVSNPWIKKGLPPNSKCLLCRGELTWKELIRTMNSSWKSDEVWHWLWWTRQQREGSSPRCMCSESEGLLWIHLPLRNGVIIKLKYRSRPPDKHLTAACQTGCTALRQYSVTAGAPTRVSNMTATVWPSDGVVRNDATQDGSPNCTQFNCTDWEFCLNTLLLCFLKC